MSPEPRRLFTRNRIAAVGIVLLVLAAVAGWQALRFGRREPVTIAQTAIPYAALAQIAQQRHYFRREGLEATPLLFSYGKPALEAVLDGRADFATAAETPVMFAIMAGAPLAIVATIQVSGRSHAIVARKESGIARFEDLRGKRIGSTRGTSADFYLDTFLTARGVPKREVEIVDLQPSDLQAALADGRVDAVSAWAPFLLEIQKELGPRGLTFLDEDIHRMYFNLVATRENVRGNPGRVRKMVRALLRAEEFARQDPEEAQRLVADFCGMDPASLDEFWRLSSYRVSLDQGLLLALEDESRWAIRNGFTRSRSVPNYLDSLYLDALRAVNPRAVGIQGRY